MFLFVSNAACKQTGFRRATLSAALLALSMTVQAESVPEVTASSPENASSQQAQNVDGEAQNYHFPHWPHHLQESKTIIPPPPPGPYKSSALNDYSVRAPVHKPAPVHRSVKPSSRRQAAPNDFASAPMDMFSPDIPWPKNLRPPQRMPEHRVSNNAQHYAAPRAMVAPSYQPAPYGPLMKQRYGNYRYGEPRSFYPGTPKMNGMAMDSSRWMPSVGMAPPGPYNPRGDYSRRNYAPNFSPNYGSNYAPRYNRPVTGNSGMQSTNHPYR